MDLNKKRKRGWRDNHVTFALRLISFAFVMKNIRKAMMIRAGNPKRNVLRMPICGAAMIRAAKKMLKRANSKNTTHPNFISWS